MRKQDAITDAIRSLASADYDLAVAARLLEEAEHPRAAEAESLFQAALKLRVGLADGH